MERLEILETVNLTEENDDTTKKVLEIFNVTVDKLTGKLSYNVTGDKKIEMHELAAQNKEEDALAEKMKKEEKSLEEKLTRKKKQDDQTGYLPTTKQRPAASKDGKITEMSGRQGKIRKDAMRTPTT